MIEIHQNGQILTEISSEEMSVKIFSLDELNLVEIIYVLIRPRADATLRQLFTYAQVLGCVWLMVYDYQNILHVTNLLNCHYADY